MKKIICLFAFLGSFFLLSPKVLAAPSSSLTLSKSKVEVGESVSATLKVVNVAAWKIDYFRGTGSTNGCSIKDDLRAGNTDNANNTTKTFKITCTASSTGTIKFDYSGFFTDSSYNKITPSDKKYVTVVAARPKSTNNYLKSLSVTDGTITPEFKKDVLEYTATFEAGTEKVTINAEKEDGYASLSGTGEKEVIEGDNKFEIVVTSESGSSRTYILNVVVKEFAPINVEVDGKDYTVVRKIQELTKPENFTETTVQIGEETVPAFYNEKLNKTLVGLKNVDGKIYLFEYNDGKYERYYEFLFKGITLNIIKMDKSKLPDNYKAFKETINEEELEVYKLKKSSKFALVYGIDVTTGDKDLYQIDLKNNTVQRYNDESVDVIKDNNQKSLIIFGILGGVIFLEFLIILASKHRNKKILNVIKNDKINKVKKEAIKESKEESIDKKELKTTKIDVDKVEEEIIDDNSKAKKKKKKSK